MESVTLYNDLIDLLNNDILPNKLKLEYDTQSLFNYFYYFKNNKKYEINIIGLNTKKNLLNGLAIWNSKETKKFKHANMTALKNLYFDKNILKSRYYPDKDIHVVSFTFYTLNKLYNTPEFKKLFL